MCFLASKKHKFILFAKSKYMKNSLVKNLSWVLIGSIIAKLIGGLYRIVLTRILGADIGFYQLVFSAYSFLIVLISSGVPLAISKLISEAKSEKKQQKILNGALTILFSISAILACVLALGSKGLALIQGERKLYLCYIILAPSLVFSALSAILKGYKQGQKNFCVPAIANIIEQIVRVVFGLILMLAFKKLFLLGALIGAVLGTLVGDFVSLVFLKIACKTSFKINLRYIQDGKTVFKHSYLIMIYSLIVPFSNFVDSFLVVRLLGVNLPIKTSTLLYGLQSGVVGALLSIPNIFSFSLVSVLMPRLSKTYSNNNMKEFDNTSKLAFKLVLFVALPCAVLFAINSERIINLIYGTTINGFGVNGQYVAKNLLIISSFGVVFSGINQLSAIILQNLNNHSVPIINLLIGMVCKLIIELMFIPSKGVGIYAYGIAIIVGVSVSAILNIYAIEKFNCHMIDISYLTKQFGLGVTVLGLFVIFKLFDSNIVFMLGTIFIAIIYLIGAYVIKLFKKQDINLIINSE